VPVVARAGASQWLASRLRDLEVRQCRLLRGLTAADLEHLAIVMSSTREEVEDAGGIEAILRQLGVEHVEMRRGRYELVEEGQAVADAGAVERTTADLAQDDAETLAQKILAGGGAESPEVLAQRIVHSLKRTYEALSGDAVSTQKRRRQVTQMLQEARAHLVAALPAAAAAERDAVAETVDAMVDDLRMASLAEEYLKGRKSYEQKEARILRYVQAHAGEEGRLGALRERLLGQGLSVDGWAQIAARSGGEKAGGAATGPEMGAEAGPDAAASGSFDRARVVAWLREVEREAARLAQVADARIRDLEARVRRCGAPEAPESRGEQAMARIWAEAVQELTQPLAAIRCAVDMVRQRHVGPLESVQEEVLDLASTQAQRLEGVLDRLAALAGMPASLAPDAAVRQVLTPQGGQP
jgi:hypothetical protein